MFSIVILHLNFFNINVFIVYLTMWACVHKHVHVCVCMNEYVCVCTDQCQVFFSLPSSYYIF